MVLSKKELGQLIKKARNLKSDELGIKYTQQMLSHDIGKSQSYIGDIESGRSYPSFVILNSIAISCGVPISYFENTNKIDKTIDDFIKLQLPSIDNEEIPTVRKAIKEEPDVKMDYIYNYIKTNYNLISNLFETPEGVLKFLLRIPTIIDFCEININEMDKSDIDNFISDLLSQLKLISYKYKK